MGLQGFATFQQLLKMGHYPPRIGFGAKVKAADINRFANRMRLAKDFKGILLEGYSDDIVAGYSAFCHIVLVHSALERFMEINALGKNLGVLAPLMVCYQPESVLQEFIKRDKKDLLYNFLHEKVNDSFRYRTHFEGCS